MPDDQHPGFAYWQVDQHGYPFPAGDISITDKPTGVRADGTIVFTPPDKLPHDQTVAERSIGFPHSSKLWFALECTQDAQGVVTCEAVIRGQHVHWYVAHGETGPGPQLEVRISQAEMSGWGMRERMAGHGPHCDILFVDWGVRGDQARVTAVIRHEETPVAEFLKARKKAALEAERHPPPVHDGPVEVPIVPLPIPPMPPPMPDPEDADGN
jgi:hypothetical protein